MAITVLTKGCIVLRRKQPEAHLLLLIIKLLRLHGLKVGKVKVKGTQSPRGNFILDPYLMRGLPDAIAFDKDVMYAIETKVKGNSQTPDQKEFEKLFHYPPSRIYILAYSWEDVESVIGKSKRRLPLTSEYK